MGRGSAMVNSKITLGYANENGEIEIGDYEADDYVLPTKTASVSQLVPLVGEAPAWAELSFSFQIPAISGGDAPYVWASNFEKPVSLSDFEMHSSYGVFSKVNFGPEGSGARFSSRNQLWFLPLFLFLL